MLTDTNLDLSILNDCFPEIFTRLRKGKFIIQEEASEYREKVAQKLLSYQNDTELYHIVVNPTLDCNLECWYCYESKIPFSTMGDEMAEAVCKNISSHYERHPYKTLKLSFFGGEPFMRPQIIKYIVEFCKEFCKSNKIALLLDFTTNGTLITKSILDVIKDCACMFQITFDGHKNQHNTIKKPKYGNPDTYSLTLNNIYRIQENIPNSFVSVRINFDRDTLEQFQDIMKDLDKLDRMRTKIILKKVWQVDSDTVSKDIINKCIDAVHKNNFVLDYYSQGGVCFADRTNQVTINFDGTVHKCTTINKFDSETALGFIDQKTGNIKWNKERTDYLSSKIIPDSCRSCTMFPSCGGPCRKKVASWKEENCLLTSQNISVEEYALVQFKTNLVRDRIIKSAKNQKCNQP